MYGKSAGILLYPEVSLADIRVRSCYDKQAIIKIWYKKGFLHTHLPCLYRQAAVNVITSDDVALEVEVTLERDSASYRQVGSSEFTGYVEVEVAGVDYALEFHIRVVVANVNEGHDLAAALAGEGLEGFTEGWAWFGGFHSVAWSRAAG